MYFDRGDKRIDCPRKYFIAIYREDLESVRGLFDPCVKIESHGIAELSEHVRFLMIRTEIPKQ